MSESDSPDCPLCMELFEIDDLHFYPCTCGYQICRFCWHRIRTVGNGLCPACRKEYTEDPAHYRPPSQEEIQRVKKERKKTENQRKQKVSATRQHLSDIRVIQKHLVFVVGLSNKMADVETLCQHEYFGKYGKILKIVINPNTHYAGPQGPSASAYITYKNVDDALKAITAINNMPQPLKLRASLGTTKYCSHYLRNMACPKPDCMYLHDVGDENASFTKEDMQAGKHQLFEKNLLDNYASKTSAKQDHHHHVVSSKKPILINSTSNNTAADDNSQAHNHRNSGEEWEDGNPLLPSQASWGKESHMTQARSTKTPEPKTVVALSPKKIPPGSPSKSRPLSQNLSEPKKTVNKKTSVVKEDPKTNAVQPTVIQKPPPQPQLEPQLQKLDNQSPQTGFPQNTPQSLSQNLQNMPPQSLPQSSLPQNPPPNLLQQPISAPPNLHQKPLQNSAQHLPPQITQTAKDLQQQQQQQQDTIPQQPTANVDIPAATAKTMSIAPPPGVSKPPAADFPWSLGGMDLGLSDLQISASDDELGFDPFRESKCGLEDLMALEKQQGVTAKKPAQPSFSWDSFFPSDFVQNMCNQQQQQSYSLFGLGAGLQQQQQPRPPPSMHPNSGMVGGYPTGGGRYNHPYANHPQFAQMNASGHPATPQFPGAPPQPPHHHQPPPRVVPPPPPGVLLPGAIGPEADKNWQEGLRALLPNINISFGNPGGVQSPSEPPAPSNNSVTNLFTLPPGFASLPPPVLPPATVAQQIPPVQQQSQPPAGQQWNRAVVPPAINEGKPLQQQNVRPPPPPGFSAPVQQQQQMQQQLQQQQQLQIQQQQQRLKEQEHQKLQKIQQQQQQLKLQQQQHQQIFCNIQQNVIPQPQQQVAPNKPTPGIITVPPTLKSSVLQNSSTNHAAKQQQGEDPSILWSRVLADEQKDISTAEMSFPLPGETQDRPLHQVHRQPSLTSWNTVAAKQTKPDATPDIKQSFQSYALHISIKDEQAQQQPQQKPSPIFGSQQKHAGLKNKPTAHVKPLKNNNSQNDGFTTVQGGASSGRVTVQNNPPPQQQQLQQPPVANSNQQQQHQQSWRVSELDDFSTDFPAPINSSAVSSNKMKKKKKKGKEMVEPVTSETIVGRVEVCIPEEERPKKQKNKNKTKTSPTQTRKVVEPAPAPLSTPLATPLTTPIATKQPIRILKSDGNNSASNSLTQAVAERSSSSQEQEIVSRFTESTEKLLKNVLFETEAIKLNTEQISKDLKSALQRCKESSLSLADLEKINILLAPGNIGAGIDDFVDTSFLERQVESARREAKVLEARLNEVIRKNMASELETLKRNTKK